MHVFVLSTKNKKVTTANRPSVTIPGRPCKKFPHIQFDHHTKFACSHTVRAHVRGQKHFGDTGTQSHRMGAWLTPRNMPIPTCYHAKFGHSMSNRTSVTTEMHQKKIDLLRSAFQGPSRSPEPTRIDRLPMTSY